MELLILNQKTVANISINAVLLIEKEGRKLRVVTDSREFSYYEKLDNITNLLDNTFFLCRKGCYINFSKVTIMENQCITFENGMNYWLGRDNFNKTRKAFINYLNKKKSL